MAWAALPRILVAARDSAEASATRLSRAVHSVGEAAQRRKLHGAGNQERELDKGERAEDCGEALGPEAAAAPSSALKGARIGRDTPMHGRWWSTCPWEEGLGQ